MQTESPPAIDLTQYAEAIDPALAEGTPCIWASASKDGTVDIAPKGSTMVFDKDHLAFLERSHGKTIDNLRQNPSVAMIYRSPERKVGARRFYGVVEQVVGSGDLREQIRGRTIQAELDRDPDNRGVGVLVRIDRIVEGGRDVQRR